MNVGLLILIAVIVIVVAAVIGLYNGLVQKRLRIDEAYSQIEVQLKRRHDLIPNIVNAVKGYMGFEQKVLTDVTNARAAAVAAGSQGPAQQAAAETMLSGALRQLFALSESYPDLKANANFQQLQAELSDIENKLAAARRFFNNAVQEYNTGIQNFPAVLIAGPLGFREHAFFDLGEGRAAAEQAPQVKF